MQSASSNQKPSDRARTSRIPFLDVVRSVAILLVLCCHFRHLGGAGEWFKYVGLRGYVGVDVFFVLSGWLIGGQLLRALAREGTIDLRRFWTRRALRTVPVYLVMFIVFAATHDVSGSTAFSMLFFVQNYTAPLDWPITWSLCIEEHFYVMLPVLLLPAAGIARKRKQIVLLGVGLILISPVLRWATFGRLSDMSYYQFLGQYYSPTHLRLEGLFLGVAAAAVHQFDLRLWRLIRDRARAVLALGVALFVVATWHPSLVGATSDPALRMTPYCAIVQFFVVSVGAALVILAGVALHERAPQRPGRLTRWLSDHAYTLYLTHCVALSWILKIQAGLSLGFATALMLTVTLSIALSILLRTLVERPALRLRDALTTRPRSVPACPTPIN